MADAGNRRIKGMDPYERLAGAVIERAVADYRREKYILKKKPWSRDAKKKVKELEEFFHSPWFEMLSRLDGEDILERLQKEA